MTDRPARRPRADDAERGARAPDSRTAEEVLAEAANLRAARIREALEIARGRRLEVEAMRKQRDEAFRQRDLANQAMARLRKRTAVRLVLAVIRFGRRVAGRAKRANRAGPVPASQPAGRVAAGAPGGRSAAMAPGVATPWTGRVASRRGGGRWSGPADYRSYLLDRLRGRGGRLAVALAGAGGDGAVATANAAGLRKRGWSIDSADAATLDVLLVTSPAHDPRTAPREAIVVAAVDGDPAAWTAQPWFDAFDVVLVRDEAAATFVREHTAKVARVVRAAGDRWPTPDAIGSAIEDWATRTRIAVMVQALRWDLAEPSGDYHLARALQRQFERRGHPTSVYFQRQWAAPATAREDIVIHLWGRYEFAVRPTQVNALWILYHPELVTDELVGRYDAVFAASDLLAEQLAARSGREVRSLHQTTDPERFRPTEGGPHHELLFVGNSRGTRRTIIDDLTPTSHDLAVYGGGWADDLLDPAYLRGTVVSNRDLPAWYSGADIVLNDHWVESVEAGLINNRLYDALATGAFVISDSVPGLEEEFDGAVVTYTDPADLALTVERYLGDPAARRAVAERGRRAVLERHTVSRRADELLGVLLPLVPDARLAGDSTAVREPVAGSPR